MKTQNKKVFNVLIEMHPNAECELKFSSVFELLISVILSAQCTDKRVNIVTTKLFKIASTPEDFCELDILELEKLIFSCGFYHNKAKSIKLMAESVKELGEIPNTVDGLMTLAGVGRKTANVIYSVAFGGNAIAVDTHVFRVSNRIGLASANTPEKTEKQLMSAFDENLWTKLHHLLIFHGRYCCHSQNPKCQVCKLNSMCDYYSKI